MPLDDPSASLLSVVETLDVDTDALHDILSEGHRRYALARLHEVGEPMYLGTLAEDIAEWERDRESGTESPSVELIHQKLYHVHVAKMAEIGLVVYDGLRDTVRLADAGHALAAHLQPSPTVDAENAEGLTDRG